MLECVLNLSEGRSEPLLQEIAAPAGEALLDLHADEHHNRAVLTLASEQIVEVALLVAGAALERLDLRRHEGVHPRLGVVDVVPFVALGEDALREDGDLAAAIRARDRFAAEAATTFHLSCFVYGPERSLPEIRRRAFVDLDPDLGPIHPSARSGACCVGARRALVAYNLVLFDNDLALAQRIARSIRRPGLRTLALRVGDAVQVSCNLTDPLVLGPGDAYDLVAAKARIAKSELVGLVPAAVLSAIDPSRHEQLGLSPDRTIEHRLEHGRPKSA